jgi:hypothetical protein
MIPLEEQGEIQSLDQIFLLLAEEVGALVILIVCQGMVAQGVACRGQALGL